MDKHLAAEDATIYPALLARNETADGEVAIRFMQELNQLRHDWANFLTDWSEATIASDWQSFGTAARSMMTRLRDRTRAETALLYPLALQRSIIRLRAVRADQARR